MQLIRHHLHLRHPVEGKTIFLSVGREVLAKRRWRGEAEDGKVFGFDLEQGLEDGDFIYQEGEDFYQVVQAPEAVLEVELGDEVGRAAQVGWKVGNLHFSVEIEGGFLRVVDDLALRQLFEREGIAFVEKVAVFHPEGAVGSHTHCHAR